MMEAVNRSASQQEGSGRHSSKRKRDAVNGGNKPSKKATRDAEALDFQRRLVEAHRTSQGVTQDSSEPAAAGNAKYASIDTEAAAAAMSQYTKKMPQQTDGSFLTQTTDNGSRSGDAEANETLQPPESSSTNARRRREKSSSADPPTPPHTLYQRHDDHMAYRNRPAVGTKAYEAQRRANHKEVERRRRETINEGINELASVVPGCDREKSKGDILFTASMYIQKLQEEANTNIDKWTFEKLITEQAISEMSSKLGQTWQEKNVWKEKAKEAGVDVVAVESELRKGINEVLSDEADPRNGKAFKDAKARAEAAQTESRTKQTQTGAEPSGSDEEEDEDEE